MKRMRAKKNDCEVVKDCEEGKMTWKRTRNMIEKATKQMTRNMIKEMNKDVLPPRDTSPFVVISIERCSMTVRSPKGGDELGQADLAQGSTLENQAPSWIDR